MITGLGVISPLGNTPEQLLAGLMSSQSAVRDLTSLPTTTLPTRFGAEALEFSSHIDDFGPLDGEKKKTIRKTLKVMCRDALMGVAAGQRAIADAGLTEGSYDPERAGAIFGADYMITAPDDFTGGILKCRGEDGRFQFSRWAEEGMPQLSPLWLLKYLPNMPAAHIGIYNDMRGPNNSITLREASANLAIGEGGQIVARGGADIIITGATGTRLHPMKIVHSITQEEVAGNGAVAAAASRPFDLHRSGMVLGEGSGALVLEELSHAQARGAKIYGEFISAGSSSVAAAHLVANRRHALANAMRLALRSAGLDAAKIGHIHAHGLSSRSCDIEEAAAIHEVFGAAASTVPVTTAKGHFGNLGAGGGAVELIASLLAMRAGQLFPTLNYQVPDPECRLKIVSTANIPSGETVLNLSVTPQGQASAVICRLAG